ncbi:hypothetical protein OTSUT76_1825 [Orientia tsutsugamushi str. UT76]|nr:hypothetical protein OTSUT76_1825 [Orientia tsutsugamushi str. UT76]
MTFPLSLYLFILSLISNLDSFFLHLDVLKLFLYVIFNLFNAFCTPNLLTHSRSALSYWHASLYCVASSFSLSIYFFITFLHLIIIIVLCLAILEHLAHYSPDLNPTKKNGFKLNQAE